LIEFISIALSIMVVLSIFITSIRVGITPMPSSQKAYRAILALTDPQGVGPIIDLGSGWGTVVIALAKAYPNREVIGFELSTIPWLISVLLKKIMKLENLLIHRRNFFATPFPESSTLICYLFPEGMIKLEEKLKGEGPKIDRIISNTFALPTYVPQQTIKLDDLYGSSIYKYLGKDLIK
jgi:hypothetical protein